MPIPLIEPMLATNRQLDARAVWVVEPKLDGWRALVYLDAGLCVRTRSGRVVTESVPELRGLVDLLPDGTVLDGELVAGQGRASDFYRLGPQMARTRRPASGLKDGRLRARQPAPARMSAAARARCLTLRHGYQLVNVVLPSLDAVRGADDDFQALVLEVTRGTALRYDDLGG